MYMVNNPSAKITSFDVVGLYTKAFNRTSNVEKAVNGFMPAGIYSIDEDKFKAIFESFSETPLQQTETNINKSSEPSDVSNADFNQMESQNKIKIFIEHPETNIIDSVRSENQNEFEIVNNI